MRKILFNFALLLICSLCYSQKVAVIGINHDDADGFSFVVTEDLANGEVIYFTENEYDNVTNVFNGINTEAIVRFTFTSAVSKGNVIHVAETGTTTNLFNVTCTGGSSCGTAIRVTGTGPFSLGSGGESLYAYSDTDDNPNNGILSIHSVLYTGFSEGENYFPGGSIITSQDPRPDYPNAIVVDGFPSVAVGFSHNRVEFTPTVLARTNVTKVILENVNNYIHGQANAPLSTIFFTNLNLVSSNPVLTVSASPSSVNENSGSSLIYTFSLSANADTNMTINFNVGGTATFGTDYSQSGAASFSSSSGTVVIPSGNNSVAVNITPIGDTILEPNETVTLTITGGSGYDAGSPGSAIGTIVNDDTLDLDPMVAITGISHTDPDAFSFVAVQDIPANTVIYFTDHSFNTSTLRFSTIDPESILHWTSPGTVIPRGHVIVVTETSTNSNTFNVTCSSGSCGNVTTTGDFAIASAGETFYAYRDTDNNPDNGITSIDSALFTGTSAVSGGNIPTLENPISVYTKAIVVSGFPSNAPLRTEYDASKRNLNVNDAVFQNVSNWLHGQAPPALSTIPFTNLNILCSTPPTPTFIQVDPICSGGLLSPLPTTSLNGINGTWFPTLDNTVTTEYTFTPNVGECGTTSTMTIVVNPNETPTFAQVESICAGGSLSALPTTSNNGINGTWSPALNNMVTTEYTFTPNMGECGTTTTMTINVNPLLTPTFTQVESICAGGSLSALPTISTNGINGTWAPALNNMATTEYTFTPNVGECGVTTTMTIVVNQNVVPTFTQVAPICAGETLLDLPTISINGIIGSWSPALNNMATTTYTFTPSSGDCITNAIMTILVNEPLVITANESETICDGNSIVLSPTVNLSVNIEGFVGAYAGSNWVQSSENSDGSIIFTETNSVMLSGNNGSNNPGFNQALITIPSNTTITFDWAYTTSDGAQYDYPQYYLNGNVFLLNGFDNTTFSSALQSGNQTIDVQAGDLFGFRIFTSDNVFGSATVTISNFQVSGNQFSWTASNGGVINGSANLATLEVNTAGTYTITVTNLASGCSDSKDIEVNVNPIPDVPIANNQTFYLNALISDLVATGTNILWYTSNTGGLPLAPSDALSTGIYYVSQTLNGCESLRTAVEVTILNEPTISSASCNSVINLFYYDLILANPFPGATSYRFRIGQSTFDSTSGSATLVNILGNSILLSNNYLISVAALVNNVWTEYGPTCQITTTDSPTTEIHYISCGSTLTNMATNIYFKNGFNVQMYEYRLTRVTDNVVLGLIQSNNRFIKLSDFIGVTYATEYNIQARLMRNNVWGAWSASCSIFSPSLPTTELRPVYCGQTLANNFSPIYANSVFGAIQYEFRVLNTVTNEVGSVIRNSSAFHLGQVQGITISSLTNYNIDVRVNINNSWGNYGTICTVTTPGIVTLLNQSNISITNSVIKVYPNPFDNQFTIKLPDNLNGIAELFDSYGKLIQSKKIQNVFEVNFETYNLSSGVYFLRVEQGLENYFLKIVKR